MNGRVLALALVDGLVAAAGLLLDDGYNTECTDGSERVGDDIVNQRGKALTVVGENAEQHVTSMGDRRIRE